MKISKLKLILKVGAAGGEISLWLVNAKDSNRSFIVTTDESTLKAFMDEEDVKGISFKSKTVPLHSFADALVALGKYPWHKLEPIFVHQDFRDPILTAVWKLGGKQEVNRWQSRLTFIDKKGETHVSYME